MAVVQAVESLRARLGALLAPIRDGSGLPPGWRLDDWDAEQGISLFLRSDRSGLRIDLEALDPSRGCYSRTALFNVYYTANAYRGADGSDPNRRQLSPDEFAVLDRIVSLVRERESTLQLPPSAGTAEKVQAREITVDRALVKDGEHSYYLNPYVGCMLACPFCYAMHRGDFSRSLDGLPQSAWGRWVDIKVNAAEVLAREVRELSPGFVRMSPIITDPYQPIERKYRVTRSILEVLSGTQFTPVVLTRSSLILEDLPLLQRCHQAVVGMSVPTDDDAMRAAFEPSTEPIEQRLATLAQLKGAGLRTFGIIQPMLPMQPERLAELLAPHISAVAIGPLNEKQRVQRVFTQIGKSEVLDERWEWRTFERLQKAFSDRGVLVNPKTPEWSFLG